MLADLANLPSSGLLPDSDIVWQRRSKPFIHISAENSAPEQVLENDNATESLLRILKQDGGAAGKQQATDAKGKRPLEHAEPTGRKKMAIAPNLAGPSGAGGAGPSGVDTKRTFTQEELKAKTVKDLQDILKARGMPVSGKKDALMQRMIDFQRRQRVAAQGKG
jgi:SAP domain